MCRDPQAGRDVLGTVRTLRRRSPQTDHPPTRAWPLCRVSTLKCCGPRGSLASVHGAGSHTHPKTQKGSQHACVSQALTTGHLEPPPRAARAPAHLLQSWGGGQGSSAPSLSLRVHRENRLRHREFFWAEGAVILSPDSPRTRTGSTVPDTCEHVGATGFYCLA